MSAPARSSQVASPLQCGVRVVTEAQAIARIRRRLAKDGEVLRSCRDTSLWFSDRGHLCVIDSSNCIVASHCTVRGLAAELEILRDGEVLAEDVQ